MALVIEFYAGETKLCAVRAPSASLAETIAVAHAGLEYHKARHALVLDIDRGKKVVGMVHRDVLP